MGLFDWFRKLSSPTPARLPSHNTKPQGDRVRIWAVALRDGKQFGGYEIYHGAMGFQVLCVKGLGEGRLCKTASGNGFYEDLKAALHGVSLELSILVYAVLASKLESLRTGEQWSIRNPDQLVVVDATWADQAGGVLPLGQVFFDEDRLEVVEALLVDPDTCESYPSPGCRVIADGNGSAR